MSDDWKEIEDYNQDCSDSNGYIDTNVFIISRPFIDGLVYLTADN